MYNINTQIITSAKTVVERSVIIISHCIFLHWWLCFLWSMVGIFLRLHLGSIRPGFLCGRSAGGILWVTAGSALAPRWWDLVIKVWESWLQRKPVLRARSRWLAGRRFCPEEARSFLGVKWGLGEGRVSATSGSSQLLWWTCKPATSFTREKEASLWACAKGYREDRGDGMGAQCFSVAGALEARVALCVSTSTCAPRHSSTAQWLPFSSQTNGEFITNLANCAALWKYSSSSH